MTSCAAMEEEISVVIPRLTLPAAGRSDISLIPSKAHEAGSVRAAGPVSDGAEHSRLRPALQHRPASRSLDFELGAWSRTVSAMSRSPSTELGHRRSTVVLFTQTFPFSRGEEFLEAEIDQLVAVFDQVLVVPTLWAPEMLQSRELPSGAIVVTPPATWRSAGRAVATFLVRHPFVSLRSIARAVHTERNPRAALADLKFEIRALAVANAVAAPLADSIAAESDVVLYAFWLHLPARVALEARRLLGLKTSSIVSRANGFDLYVERHRHQSLPQRDLLLDGVDQVFAASDSAEQYLRDRYPDHQSKYSTDRIGTTPALNPGNANKSAMHFVSCSYVVPVKRLPMLIDNLAEAQRVTGLPLSWTHIGSGAGEYQDAVMAHAAEMLAPGSFRFLGHMDSAELRQWYAENPATAFLQMSESEGGLAASIQEALAQGLPVIATDVGGVRVLGSAPELFDGLLQPSHTPAEFVDHVRRLLASDDLAYSRYVEASMSYWHAHCSAEVLASALAHRLRRIASQPRVSQGAESWR